jgi:hypothetical protein
MYAQSRSMPGGAAHSITCHRYYVSAALITEAGTDRAQGRRIVAFLRADPVPMACRLRGSSKAGEFIYTRPATRPLLRASSAERYQPP